MRRDANHGKLGSIGLDIAEGCANNDAAYRRHSLIDVLAERDLRNQYALLNWIGHQIGSVNIEIIYRSRIDPKG